MTTNETIDAEQPADEDEQLTSTTKTRWEWLSSVTAGVTVAVFLALVVASAVEPWPVSMPGAYVLAAFLAVSFAAYTYAIGEDVAGIFDQIRGGGSE